MPPKHEFHRLLKVARTTHWLPGIQSALIRSKILIGNQLDPILVWRISSCLITSYIMHDVGMNATALSWLPGRSHLCGEISRCGWHKWEMYGNYMSIKGVILIDMMAHQCHSSSTLIRGMAQVYGSKVLSLWFTIETDPGSGFAASTGYNRIIS